MMASTSDNDICPRCRQLRNPTLIAKDPHAPGCPNNRKNDPKMLCQFCGHGTNHIYPNICKSCRSKW